MKSIFKKVTLYTILAIYGHNAHSLNIERPSRDYIRSAIKKANKFTPKLEEKISEFPQYFHKYICTTSEIAPINFIKVYFEYKKANEVMTKAMNYLDPVHTYSLTNHEGFFDKNYNQISILEPDDNSISVFVHEFGHAIFKRVKEREEKIQGVFPELETPSKKEIKDSISQLLFSENYAKLRKKIEEQAELQTARLESIVNTNKLKQIHKDVINYYLYDTGESFARVFSAIIQKHRDKPTFEFYTPNKKVLNLFKEFKVGDVSIFEEIIKKYIKNEYTIRNRKEFKFKERLKFDIPPNYKKIIDLIKRINLLQN